MLVFKKMRTIPWTKLKLVTKRLAFLGIALLLVAVVPAPIYAQPGGTDETQQPVDPKQAELKAYIQNTPWYDPTAGLCDPNSSTTLIGKDNIQKAFNFFISKRLSPAQAAGIVGNLMQETAGINPKSGNPAASGGGGGIAQWEGGRWNGPDGLLAFAEKNGKPWDDLGLQLDFIWYEMPKQYAYGKLGELQAILPQATSSTSSLEAVKLSTTYEIAAQAWELTYERASIPVMEKRIEYAGQVMAMLGGTVGGGPDTTTGCGGSGILVGEYSFPLAPQKKQNYGYTLPCTDEVNQRNGINGPYTRNREYTDIFGQRTLIRACHHDATPAFDLSYGGVGGKSIHAITKGRVVSVSPFGTCNEIQFKANISTDQTYYWYGHVVATVGPGDYDAGAVLGYVAPESYGSSCWMGGVHLHIDRGCIVGGTLGDLTSGTPQTAGRKGCRNPAFLDDLVKIWEALPE